MLFDVEVKVSLKKGMLNPEATTIEKSLELLGYNVDNLKTVDVIKFQMNGDDRDTVIDSVRDICERLLSNPVIHNYEFTVLG